MPRRAFRRDSEIRLSHPAPFPPPPQMNPEWDDMRIHGTSLSAGPADCHYLGGQVGTTASLFWELLSAAHGLAHLKALELRMAEIERLVVAGLVMRGAEGVRFRPGLEHRMIGPDRV